MDILAGDLDHRLQQTRADLAEQNRNLETRIEDRLKKSDQKIESDLALLNDRMRECESQGEAT